MSLIALNFMGNVIAVPTNSLNSTTVNSWWSIAFTHPVMAPVLWGSAFFVSGMILLWSSFRLILPSVPQGLVFLLLLFSILLAQGVRAFIYVRVAPLYDGGWMPSLQRTWLSLGVIIFVLFSVYLFWWSAWLAGAVFLGTLFYSWRYFPRQRRQRNPLTAFSDLVNAKQRIEAPGIRWVEHFCLVGFIFWFLLSAGAFIEKAIPLRQPGYTVKILGKEMNRGGKGSPTYTVIMAGWRTPHEKLSQKVFHSEYDALRPGQSYRMLTWRGILGTEYLKQFK